MNVEGPNWDPKGVVAFNWVVQTVRDRFDRELVRTIASEAEDPRVVQISNRVMTEAGDLHLGEPAPLDTYDAAFTAARARDPEAIVVVPPDGHGYDGGVVLDAVWTAASKVAFAAAVAYLYPNWMSVDESALLSRRWESVFGEPP